MTRPLTDAERDRYRAMGRRTVGEVLTMADQMIELFCDLCGKPFTTITIAAMCPRCRAIAGRSF